jgi:hypothetical protein
MEITDSDIVIEGANAVFDLNITAPIGGTYMGTFKFRCTLSPLQIIDADRDYRDLIGNQPSMVAETADNLAFSLSQLKQRIVLAPSFWTENSGRFPGGGVKDLEVISKVLEAAFLAENKYRRLLQEKHESAVKRLQSAIERKKELEKTEAQLAEMDKADRDDRTQESMLDPEFQEAAKIPTEDPLKALQSLPEEKPSKPQKRGRK